MIERGPIPAIHGVARWRLIDLAQWFFEEFRITIAKQTLSRELRAMGYRKLSARPRHHAQPAGAIEDFKKVSFRAWTPSHDRRRGTRPSAPRDQRTASTYIFGAICPKDGKGAALILPACNTEAMNLHLVEIAKTVAPGGHAVLLVDQAGWHLSTGLVVPPNITIIALPPK